MRTADLAPIEYLYGTWWSDDDNGYHVMSVIPFRIVKKTAKRIFYVKDWINGETARLGSVNRQELEDKGEVYNHSRGYWNADFHLTAKPHDLDTNRVDPSALKAELAKLRVEMADVHPDRGGTDAAFIAAHKRYEAAREKFRRLVPAVAT